ncbi:MAG: BatD family protein [Pseudomonadota bacterium]|nr:BatD family protein [Pseudomonadota bacterium]
MLLQPGLSQAAVQARLERNAVSAGATLTLAIESDSAQPGAQPDLAPLQKDFVVLGSASQSETSFVNGRRSDRMRWSVRLQPRHAGKLVIPAIALGSEQTAPLDVDVGAMSPRAAAQVSDHVFVEIEAGAAGRSVYVQQQTPYTVRLYYDDSIQNGELAAPAPADAVVEQLGADKHGSAMRNGRSYNVLERTYAIAPEKSGTLRIPPLSFSGSQVLPQGGQAQGQDDANPGDDLFARMLRQSPLGNDPLFKNFASGAPFGEAAEPVAVQGKEVVLEVKPRPAAAAHADWLPAEAIALHDSWQDNPPQLKASEPATRTITVQAKGLSASQIPPLSLAQPGNARLYPEAANHQSRTDGKTIFGISTQKITYIPNARGRLDLPAVELTWWDLGSDQPRTAALPALSFSVAPGVAGDVAPPGPAGQPTPTLAAPTTANHPLSGEASPGWNPSRVGLIACALLAAVLLAFGLAIGRRRRRRARNGVESNAAVVCVPPKAASLRALQRACSANDRHAAAGALLDLARAQWPDDPACGLGALAFRLDAGAAEVSALERSLYGAEGASPWRGDALWHVVRRGLRARRTDASLHEDGLKALYPVRGQPDQGLRAS